MKSRRGSRAPLQNRSNDEVLAGSTSHGQNIEYRGLEQWKSRPDKQRGRADDAAVVQGSEPHALGRTAVDRQRPWSCGGYPPIACSLVTFEPGSLGLELEAIVDEGASAVTKKRAGRERLGCRVLRVTPNGQAARHGNIHPGDAIVVLDGIQVLSKPFDVITQELLERRDQRRLLGFMGAAAVAAPLTGISSAFSSGTVENGSSSQGNERRYVSRKEDKRKRAREGASSTEVSGSKPDEQRHDDSVINTASTGGGKDETGVGANAAGDKRGELSSSPRRSRYSSSTASTLFRDDFLGSSAKRRGARVPWSSVWEVDPLPSSQTPRAGEPGAGCHGRGACGKVSGEGPTFGELSSVGGGTSAMGCSGGRLGSTATEGIGVMREDSVRRRERSALPLEKSRGESLQRTLERVMEEKSAMVVEREWLLEEVQRAREVMLEKEGELAGQEVKADVLKMEVNALEIELRRARQELGSCEAVRREVRAATKRDLASRDEKVTRLSSLLAAAERRAVDAEERALKEVEKREAEVAAALRREREGKEMEVRERGEEVAALTMRMEASEGHARMLAEEKEIQIREMEEAMVKSLGAAERRRSELEKHALKMAARLKERHSEAKRLEKRTKELEERLEKTRARNVELEKEGAVEVGRLRRALERAKKAGAEFEARARVEEDRLSRRLRKEELERTAITAHLRTAEHRARVLETGAIAARRRAELGTQKEKKALRRLAEAERALACQDVAVTALKAQLEQQRQSTVAGDAATRENIKAKTALQELLKKRPLLTGKAKNIDDYDGRELVELAEAVRRWVDEREQELEGVREALEATRRDKEALLEREGDAAELRSLLEQKRGVSAELVGVAESTRARAERAEGEAERLRAEASSLRETVEKDERQAAQHEKAVEALRARIAELEVSLEAARKESEALAVRAAAADREMVEARAELARARDRVSPLEEGLREAIRRFTLKDADCVALKARLDGTMAELDTVKIALFQESDERVSGRNKACVIIAAVLARGQARKTARTIALLRWRRATAVSASPDPSSAIGGGVSSGGSGDEKEGEMEALARRHAGVLENYRAARSELASVYLRTRMCGARVLTGVLSKWATRRQAAAFWRLAMACAMGDSPNDDTGGSSGRSLSWGYSRSTGGGGGGDDGIDNSQSDIGWRTQTPARIAMGAQKHELLQEKNQRRQDGDDESDNHSNHNVNKPRFASRPWRRRADGGDGCDYDDDDYDDDYHRGYLSSATTVSPSAVAKDLVLLASPADSNTTTTAAVDVDDSKSDCSSGSCNSSRGNSRSRSGRRGQDAGRKAVAPEKYHGQSSPSGSSWGSDSAVAAAAASLVAPSEDVDSETKANQVSGLESSSVSCASSEPRYHCLPGSSSRSLSASPEVRRHNGRGWDGAIAAFDVSDGSEGEPAEQGGFSLGGGKIRRQQQQHKKEEYGSCAQSGGVSLRGEAGTGLFRDDFDEIQQQQMEGGCDGGLSVGGEAETVMYGLKIPPIAVGGDDSAWWAYSDDSAC